jgi:hypothetical protein
VICGDDLGGFYNIIMENICRRVSLNFISFFLRPYMMHNNTAQEPALELAPALACGRGDEVAPEMLLARMYLAKPDLAAYFQRTLILNSATSRCSAVIVSI